jgi:dipeptidyl aminopeptidase/acylaminoacyl peptidase
MAATPFHDLNEYLAIPRVGGLSLAPDGTWLAASVQTLSPDRKKYLTSIWRIPVRADTGAGGSGVPGTAARRLTRSAEGEGSPRFLPDGSLLFASKRPDPDTEKKDDAAASSLWLLAPGGGEARVIATLPGGVSAVETAAAADTIVVASPVLLAGPEPADLAAEKDARKARADAGVTAILHETVPIRYWDHDLGPDDLRLFAVSVPADGAAAGESAEPQIRDLTPDAGRALLNQSFALSPDGTQVAAGWWQWRDGVQSHSELVVIDVASGKRTALASDPEFDYGSPRFSPDGQTIVASRSGHHTPEKAHDVTLVTVPVRGNGDTDVTDIAPGLDRWPGAPEWDEQGRSAYFTTDDGGRHPLYRATTSGAVARVTPDNGYYSDVAVPLKTAASDGVVFAVRNAVDEPPTPVRINPATGEFERLPAPGQRPDLPGMLTEIQATADDGHPIRSWLVLPAGTSAEQPAPLALWVHGGPMMSWNNWSWRWNPWLMAARGYAVLLPDPALSTGYGQDFVQRGYHSWGDRPFRDIMAATDAAVSRDDIDGTRTAMMGGSYGGYMANWIAGHTDRFGAIVSHAGLWMLDQMFGTTDMPQFWRPQFGDPVTSRQMYEQNSPHLHADAITTPMLLIHGNQDYRVPLGEAQRLWWDLLRRGKDARFLYFPDENHWILSPGNARVWYETVLAFLAHHVLGQDWERPEML